MKKKRILLGVIITILLIIISSILVYLLVIKKDNNNIEERLNINEIITIPKIDISLGDSFYLEKEDNKLVVYDYNNKKLSEQELGEEDFYEIYNNKKW